MTEDYEETGGTCIECLAPMIVVNGEKVCKREYFVIVLNQPYKEKPS